MNFSKLPSTLGTQPNETLLTIFHSLPSSTLLRLRLLSTRFSVLTTDSLSRRTSLVLHGRPLAPEQQNLDILVVRDSYCALEAVSRLVPHLTSLSLESWNHQGCSVPSDTQMFAKLEAFSLSEFSGNLGSLLGKFGPCLRSLTLNETVFWSKEIPTLFKEKVFLQGLTHLYMKSSPPGYGILRNLLDLLEDICANCKQLKVLDIGFVQALMVKMKIHPLHSLPALTTLHFHVALLTECTPQLWTLFARLFNHQPLETVRTLYLHVNDAKQAGEWSMPDFASWIHLAFPQITKLEMLCKQPNIVEAIENDRQLFAGGVEHFSVRLEA